MDFEMLPRDQGVRRPSTSVFQPKLALPHRLGKGGHAAVFGMLWRQPQHA